MRYGPYNKSQEFSPRSAEVSLDELADPETLALAQQLLVEAPAVYEQFAGQVDPLRLAVHAAADLMEERNLERLRCMVAKDAFTNAALTSGDDHQPYLTVYVGSATDLTTGW